MKKVASYGVTLARYQDQQGSLKSEASKV